MNREETFLKQLETYLDLEFKEFDKTRIMGYLKEYVGSLPISSMSDKSLTLVRHLKSKKFTSSIRRYPNDTDPYQIVKLICYSTGITEKEILGKDRYAHLIIARHVAMYMIRITCNWSLKNIGAIFNRDHTTVINAINHVATLLEIYPEDCVHLIDYVNKNLPIPNEKTA